MSRSNGLKWDTIEWQIDQTSVDDFVEQDAVEAGKLTCPAHEIQFVQHPKIRNCTRGIIFDDAVSLSCAVVEVSQDREGIVGCAQVQYMICHGFEFVVSQGKLVPECAP